VLSLRRGTVTDIAERTEGLVRLEVDGRACIAYPRLTGPVALGDDVIVNVQALELELGSGGFDVLFANLTRGLDLPADPGAHVMKLPYTPLQFARRHAEEETSLPQALGGMPVVATSLHSQLAPVCAALAGETVAYVQLAGGALPVSFSDAARTLKERELLALTVSAGPCFDGDVDCVNVFSALVVAYERGANVVVCGIGPGVIGTGTRFGHGGMAAANAVFAAHALGGRPVLALRLSERDSRERHQGLSHHSEAVLSLCGGSCRAAWPDGCPIEHQITEKADAVDVSDWEEACAGLPLLHMGRGPREDPWFFAAAFAAGRLAKGLLT
jgi:Protein of unknown function (DUF3866)